MSIVPKHSFQWTLFISYLCLKVIKNSTELPHYKLEARSLCRFLQEAQFCQLGQSRVDIWWHVRLHLPICNSHGNLDWRPIVPLIWWDLKQQGQMASGLMLTKAPINQTGVASASTIGGTVRPLLSVSNELKNSNSFKGKSWGMGISLFCPSIQPIFSRDRRTNTIKRNSRENTPHSNKTPAFDNSHWCKAHKAQHPNSTHPFWHHRSHAGPFLGTCKHKSQFHLLTLTCWSLGVAWPAQNPLLVHGHTHQWKCCLAWGPGAKWEDHTAPVQACLGQSAIHNVRN